MIDAAPPPAAHAVALKLVEEAEAAMGGDALLRGLKVVRLKGISRRNALEQSMRPEGPYAEEITDFDELRRFETPALRREMKARGYAADWWKDARWRASTLLVDGGEAGRIVGGKAGPGSPAVAADADELLALGPERLLLTAHAAADLTVAPQALLHGYRHDVVRFTWKGAPVRLYLEPTAHTPAVVEIVRPRPLDIFWGSWGDITTRIAFELWTREPGGLSYPRQWAIQSNGLPERSVMIDEIDLQASAPAEGFALPPEARPKAPPQPIDDIPFTGQRTVTVADGILQVPGSWNVNEIIVDGGVYLLEGPISSGYSAKVLAWEAGRGRKVLGVITTSDSWPHIGGLREYAARGVPIIALDRNRPILERLMAAPHVQRPDALARAPKPAKFRFVSTPIELGEGAHRPRIIPLHLAGGERQMAVYFPATKTLYSSDLFTVTPNGVFLPLELEEFKTFVAREKLDVKTVFGMHYAPTPWSKLSAGVARTPR